jgi:hypothetical protein
MITITLVLACFLLGISACANFCQQRKISQLSLELVDAKNCVVGADSAKATLLREILIISTRLEAAYVGA